MQKGAAKYRENGRGTSSEGVRAVIGKKEDCFVNNVT